MKRKYICKRCFFSPHPFICCTVKEFIECRIAGQWMNEWINVISISVFRINSRFLLHLLCKKFACKLDYSLLYLSVLYSIQGNKQIVPPNIIADTRRRKWHSLLSFYGDSLYVYRGPNRVGPLQKKKPQFSFLLLIFIGRERRTAAFFLKQTMATV